MKKITLLVFVFITFWGYSQIAVSYIGKYDYLIKPDKTEKIEYGSGVPFTNSKDRTVGAKVGGMSLSKLVFWDNINNTQISETEKFSVFVRYGKFKNEKEFVFVDLVKGKLVIKTVDVKTGKVIKEVKPVDKLDYKTRPIAFNENCSFLFVIKKDKKIYVINTTDGTTSKVLENERIDLSLLVKGIYFVCGDYIFCPLVPDKKYVFTDGKQKFKKRADIEKSLKKSPDDAALKNLLSTFEEKASNTICFDYFTGENFIFKNSLFNKITNTPIAINAFEKGADMKIFVNYGGKNQMVVYDLLDKQVDDVYAEQYSSMPNKGIGVPCCISPDDNYLITNNGAGIEVWDMSNYNKILFMTEDYHVTSELSSPYRGIHFDDNGYLVASLIGYKYNNVQPIDDDKKAYPFQGEGHRSYWDFNDLVNKNK